MEGSIVIFRLPPRKKNVEISKFCQRFYGQDTSSGKGKYHYRRNGFLDDIPFRKLLRGVIIVETKYLQAVANFLDSYEAETHTRQVALAEEDIEILKGHE
jgi:hypothetical protein